MRAAPVAQQPQAEPLCEDEGCPHSGTKHVCISPPQAEVVPSEWVQISEWKWDNEQGHWLGKLIAAQGENP